MKRLRLPTLVLLAAALLVATAVPAAALDGDAPPSPRWTDALLAWLFAWSPVPAVTTADSTAEPGEEPATAEEPGDPAAPTPPAPDGSETTEIGHTVDPNG